MNQPDFPLNIKGYDTLLPVVELSPELKVAFFNLHGDTFLTEHCAKHLAALVEGAEIILTAESKGLQLAHCVARNLGHARYAVARKSIKHYMKGGISVTVKAITSNIEQTLYISPEDAERMRGKKVAIVDDVISTGGSLDGMEQLIKLAGGTVFTKAFVLAEGKAAGRSDIQYLEFIPLL